MDVSRLRKDELLFELAYRGLNLYSEEKKVAELRPLLAERIEKEAAGEVFEPRWVGMFEDVEEAVILLQTKVELLNELVRPETGVFDPTNAARTRALASHCNKRLITVMERFGEMSPEMRTEVKKQALTLKTLVSEFRSMGEGRVYAASTVKTVSEVEGWEVPPRPVVVRQPGPEGGGLGGAVKKGREEKARSSHRSQAKSNSKSSRKSKKGKRKKKRRSVSESGSSACTSSSSSSSESSSSDSEPKSRRTRPSKKVPVDLHKWGVQPFSGDQSVSVCSFIADIEEKARWRGVNLNALVAAAYEFFIGDAKVWYRSVSEKIDSWKEFCMRLKEQYLPPDYYDNLMEEIRDRKQGPEESVGVYVANMCALFDRLGSGVDEEYRQDEGWKLAITVKNLAPYYTERLSLGMRQEGPGAFPTPIQGPVRGGGDNPSGC
ncbi:Activity-regulated cytoskeleton associated protein 1 [Frankliniella fusca]|uniref:Activity-regulated cytoskeleton associated protein 1 n=1 Tax=Frankliniella fusca TaxID=407009 RepID=A0AAE1H726_9NEOP|nr:Activity-regulated cytoskeleton associated protein 1 [Frankliniella fusca]